MISKDSGIFEDSRTTTDNSGLLLRGRLVSLVIGVVFLLPCYVHAETIASFKEGRVQVEIAKSTSPVGAVYNLSVSGAASSGVSVEAFAIENPVRVVIDLKNLGLRSNRVKKLQDSYLSRLRFGFSGGRTRMVLDVNAATVPKVESLAAGGKLARVQIASGEVGVVAVPSPAKPAKVVASKAAPKKTAPKKSAPEKVVAKKAPSAKKPVVAKKPKPPSAVNKTASAGATKTSGSTLIRVRKNKRQNVPLPDSARKKLPPGVIDNTQVAKKAVPSVRKTSGATLKNMSYRGTDDLAVPTLMVEVAKLKNYLLNQKSEGFYELLLQDTSLGHSTLAQPLEPPTGKKFRHFERAIARVKGDDVVVEVKVREGARIGIVPLKAKNNRTQLWLRIRR